MKLSDNVKNQLLAGLLSKKQMKRKKDGSTYLRYDRIVITPKQICFQCKGEAMFYMDIHGSIDLNRGDTLNLEGLDGYAKFTLEC